MVTTSTNVQLIILEFFHHFDETNVCCECDLKTCFTCRPLSNGQRGEVYEVDGDRVAVILDVNDVKSDGNKDEKSSESPLKPAIYWIHGNFIFFFVDKMLYNKDLISLIWTSIFFKC